ncbi:MAG: family 16 glycosylhydrolase [Sphaerochaetaceae bacterium]
MLAFLLVCLFVVSFLFAEEAALIKVKPREIAFGGLHWLTKSSLVPTSPGPNYFSGNPDSIWIDEWGLHLTIEEYDDRWWASEIYTRERVGYGTYTFTVETDIRAYDPHVVAGFFTWDTAPQEYNREIDIEFAAWGLEDGTKFQYVVQPYTDAERIVVFDPNLNGALTTHRIIWTPQHVSFASYHGAVDPDVPESETMLINRWSYPQSPSEGSVRFRINLWLYQGQEPISSAHMVVTSFSFEKWQP